MRLDLYLAANGEIKSRAVAQKMIDAGLVTVNGSVATKASQKVAASDTISWKAPAQAEVPSFHGSETTLSVLYEDERCIVIHKPAGIAVHPGTGMQQTEETVLDALRPLFAERTLPFSPAEVLVHRLDKDTTGCLLIAKTPADHLRLQKQFAGRTVEKTYLTLVEGVPKLPTAMIDAPIGRHSSERTKMSVHRATKTREAQTTYRVLASANGVSLLSCDLHTGRTHQIRVHLAGIGHPVLGDRTYANRASADFAAAHDISLICLHAATLSFTSKKRVTVTAPLPEQFLKQLKKFDLREPV